MKTLIPKLHVIHGTLIGVMLFQLTSLSTLGQPAITTQPIGQTVNFGDNVSFAVTASGTPPLSYQWLHNGVGMTNIFDDNGTAPRITGCQSADLMFFDVGNVLNASVGGLFETNWAGSYAVVVSNAFGSVTSAVANLVTGFIPTNIFNNWNEQTVSSEPPVPTTFSTGSAYWISGIRDYHLFNNGLLPGSIGLSNADGTVYGPWQAFAGEAIWGLTNSEWVVTPHVVIRPGFYTVLDSSTSTWSYNFGGGFSLVYGFQEDVPVATPPVLTSARTLPNGSFQFTFTNAPGALFDVLATTNLALPLNAWAPLSGATETSPGQFQFTDPQATNSLQRFYRARSL